MTPVEKWEPTPAILLVSRRLKWQAQTTGEPARMQANGTKLICYPYRRNKSKDSCIVVEGVAWKIKYPGEKYRSCSTETAQRLIGEDLGDG